MIRRFVLALSLSTALCMPSYARAETIAETVAQALQTHPQIKEGTAVLNAADKNISEQKSGYFPVVGLEGEGGRAHNNDMTTRADTASAGASSSWKDGGTVTFTQPLFTGFAVQNHVEGAEARHIAASYDLDSTQEDVALRAARAHLNLMRTKELLDLATDYMNKIDERRKNIDLMVKNGAADAAELLQADEVMSSAKNTRLGYEESYRQAEADYIEVTGLTPGAALELGQPQWEGAIPKSLDGAIAYATIKNSHILAADSLITAAGKDRDAEKSTLLPHVNAEVSYYHENEKYDLGDYTSDAQAVVKLSWNFETGGGQSDRIDKYGEEQNQAFAKKQEAIRTVEHDTRQKFTSMEIVDQQFVQLTDRETASEKILQNFLAQYEGGKQTNLQLINAHASLFEAKAAKIDAHYRQLLSRFELLNVMGRLREAFGDTKSPEPTNKG
jgi:adhesin transport system outer membrane protein